MTNNGPQFTAAAFGIFTKLNGIRHTRVAPYHPASNGEAERFVQTFKHAMKVATQDDGSLQAKLAHFLFQYIIGQHLIPPLAFPQPSYSYIKNFVHD